MGRGAGGASTPNTGNANGGGGGGGATQKNFVTVIPGTLTHYSGNWWRFK